MIIIEKILKPYLFPRESDIAFVLSDSLAFPASVFPLGWE